MLSVDHMGNFTLEGIFIRIYSVSFLPHFVEFRRQVSVDKSWGSSGFVTLISLSSKLTELH